MLDGKYIRIEEYKSSKEKNDYQYLYEKDDELTGDNVAVENESAIEYGKGFINRQIVHEKD